MPTTPDPVPMTAETFARPRASVHPHEHAVCVYDTHEQLAPALRAFLEEGLARSETSIFVHSFSSDEEAWAFVHKARPDAHTLRADQLVLVSLYRDAFEGAGERIDYDHVVGVVDSLVRAAKDAGRAGVRIFVDASRVYFSQKRTQEWFDFETRLGRRLQASVGLVCAYRREDAMRPELFPEMLRTHAYRFDAPG